jgi:glycosyltransferase involved in cell wall biosynthesis
MQIIKVLILYQELAPYFMNCIDSLTSKGEVNVHIVRSKVNTTEAPFSFNNGHSIQFYDRDKYSYMSLVELKDKISPDLIFCAGWVDKTYLLLCLKSYHKTICLIGFDTPWQNSLKQRISSVLFKLFLKDAFRYCWVPGKPQILYALNLGFTKDTIYDGAYSADVGYFQEMYRKAKPEKDKIFPKRFICVGRYVPQKGLKDLWQAFIQLQEEQPNEWELWCLGTGPLEAEAARHPKISHIGFIQPADLPPIISQAGVFVLPSHFEPWGVVVHEFAAAGFPLLCSDAVGAATAFLKEGINGYSFKTGDVEALKFAMQRIVQLPAHELQQMGKESTALALQNTPSIWANKLVGLLKLELTRT